jgi:hypothetical protein
MLEVKGVVTHPLWALDSTSDSSKKSRKQSITEISDDYVAGVHSYGGDNSEDFMKLGDEVLDSYTKIWESFPERISSLNGKISQSPNL